MTDLNHGLHAIDATSARRRGGVSLTDRFRQHYRVHPPHWLISTQVHLVNDGVQNKEESYGKFEEGNKLALADFATRVDAPANWLEETLIPRMEAIMRYTIDAAHARLNPKKRQACFELLGFDFMLDADLRVDLIEINSNPCLETWSCPLLEGLIPKLVDDVLRVGLDQILPPPSKNLTKRQVRGGRGGRGRGARLHKSSARLRMMRWRLRLRRRRPSLLRSRPRSRARGPRRAAGG